jgi:hypothetical protein
MHARGSSSAILLLVTSLGACQPAPDPESSDPFDFGGVTPLYCASAESLVGETCTDLCKGHGSGLCLSECLGADVESMTFASNAECLDAREPSAGIERACDDPIDLDSPIVGCCCGFP